MASMLTWRSDDPAGDGLDSARVLLDGHGLRAVGRMIRTTEAGVFTASYRLAVTPSGIVRRLVVDAATGERERSLMLSRSADGHWLADHGAGESPVDALPAVDVDLAFAPVFNTIPIRRLGLHRADPPTAAHELPMVFVALPELTVEVTEQTYRTVRPIDADAPAVVGFAAGGFAADITVDGDGLVLDYPGIARRTDLRVA